MRNNNINNNILHVYESIYILQSLLKKQAYKLYTYLVNQN